MPSRSSRLILTCARRSTAGCAQALLARWRGKLALASVG